MCSAPTHRQSPGSRAYKYLLPGGTRPIVTRGSHKFLPGQFFRDKETRPGTAVCLYFQPETLGGPSPRRAVGKAKARQGERARVNAPAEPPRPPRIPPPLNCPAACRRWDTDLAPAGFKATLKDIYTRGGPSFLRNAPARGALAWPRPPS